MVTEFCMLAPNICGSLVWDLLYVALLAPGYLENLCNSVTSDDIKGLSLKLRQNLCNILLMVTCKGLNLYTAGAEKV